MGTNVTIQCCNQEYKGIIFLHKDGLSAPLQHQKPDGGGTATFTLFEVTPADSGTYRCSYRIGGSYFLSSLLGENVTLEVTSPTGSQGKSDPPLLCSSRCPRLTGHQTPLRWWPGMGNPNTHIPQVTTDGPTGPWWPPWLGAALLPLPSSWSLSPLFSSLPADDGFKAMVGNKLNAFIPQYYPPRISPGAVQALHNPTFLSSLLDSGATPRSYEAVQFQVSVWVRGPLTPTCPIAPHPDLTWEPQTLPVGTAKNPLPFMASHNVVCTPISSPWGPPDLLHADAPTPQHEAPLGCSKLSTPSDPMGSPKPQRDPQAPPPISHPQLPKIDIAPDPQPHGPPHNAITPSGVVGIPWSPCCPCVSPAAPR